MHYRNQKTSRVMTAETKLQNYASGRTGE